MSKEDCYMNKDNALCLFHNYPDLMSIVDMQKALGIGRTKAYQLINNGEINYLKIGKSIKIPKQFLIDFVLRSCYSTDIVIGNLSCHTKGV